MLQVKPNLDIEIAQYDAASLVYTIEDYYFIQGDLVIFEVIDNQKVVFTKRIDTFDAGRAFIRFTENDTNLTDKTYEYMIKAICPKRSISETYVQGRFTVKRGIRR